MKQNLILVLGRSGTRASIWRQCRALQRWAVCCLGVCAALLQCLMPARAADVLPASGPEGQSTNALKPASAWNGREMRRYKSFSSQAKLPPVTATTNDLVEVGSVVKIDVARLAQLSTWDKQALAGQFSVPVAVIDRVLQRVATNSLPAANRLVQELRTAVVDYRFLQIEWERFHPPSEGQQTKSNALSALQAGDLAKAWELYDGLRRPEPPATTGLQPPSNLRIISGP